MSCARPKAMESKLPSPVPLPARERVRAGSNVSNFQRSITEWMN